MIVERTGEGRDRAKAKGVVFGRKPKLTRHQRREALARRAAGERLVDIARSYNVHHSTIVRRYGKTCGIARSRKIVGVYPNDTV